MLRARPWLAELPFVAAPHGPNWLSWLEGAVEALSGTGLSPCDTFEMVNVIDSYVRGGTDTAVSQARARACGTSNEDWGAAIAADLGRAISDPRFPTLSALLTSGPGGPTRTLDECFDFGLQRVLDGIQLYVDARGEPSTRRPKASRPGRRASP
jgi:hypothetical protein